MSELAFNWMTVVYFFLGGLSAGCYFFSVAANYWIKEFKPLARIGALVAPISLAIGMLFLLIDLGQPFRMWRLYFTFNPQSPVSWGSWFLIIFLALSVVYAWFLIKGEEEKGKKVAYIGLPFALAVGTYTAIILAFAPGKELWRTALLPFLFLNGGLISGIALIMLISIGRQERALLSKLGKFVAYLVLLELGMIFTEILVLLSHNVVAIASAKLLLTGEYWLLFWVVEIFLGALIPVFILLFQKTKITTSVYINGTAYVLLLVGIFIMRYILVIGGQTIS